MPLWWTTQSDVEVNRNCGNGTGFADDWLAVKLGLPLRISAHYLQWYIIFLTTTIKWAPPPQHYIDVRLHTGTLVHNVAPLHPSRRQDYKCLSHFWPLGGIIITDQFTVTGSGSMWGPHVASLGVPGGVWVAVQMGGVDTEGSLIGQPQNWLSLTTEATSRNKPASPSLLFPHSEISTHWFCSPLPPCLSAVVPLQFHRLCAAGGTADARPACPTPSWYPVLPESFSGI